MAESVFWYACTIPYVSQEGATAKDMLHVIDETGARQKYPLTVAFFTTTAIIEESQILAEASDELLEKQEPEILTRLLSVYRGIPRRQQLTIDRLLKQLVISRLVQLLDDDRGTGPTEDNRPAHGTCQGLAHQMSSDVHRLLAVNVLGQLIELCEEASEERGQLVEAIKGVADEIERDEVRYFTKRRIAETTAGDYSLLVSVESHRPAMPSRS